MRPIIRISAIVCVTMSLSQCSTLSDVAEQDYAPPPRRDVHLIQDAIPKAEPRSARGNPEQYEVFGRKYRVMASAKNFNEEGVASWYGMKFHGRETSSGEPYDVYGMTAAHKHLPIPTYVKVENLENGRSVIVKVNDRGPFVDDRIIDLSYAAATKLEMADRGTARVRVTAINPDNQASRKLKFSKRARKLLEPAVVTAAIPAGSRTEVDHRVFLQVGAFEALESAHALRETLQAVTNTYRVSWPIEVTAPQTDKNAHDAHYRVRLGPFKTVKEAELARAHFQIPTLANGHIVIDD